ncbi:MAG: N-acetylneuraminate synthase family protein, partial [Chlorobium sp.]|nr:N-acetylneuraminate synthase family protein [Chlorobium sp.]
ARQLVDAARTAGADAVKFQTFKAERLVSHTAQKAEYQKRATGAGESQLEMIKKLELSSGDHQALHQYCATQGIEFLSTAFDRESVEFLKELGLKRWKIPSGEITNLPYLRRIASFGAQIIVST